MTARQIDHNGYIEIPDNPITKEGVYKYLGSEIGGEDPNKIYYVYRPSEELEKEECINSFKLIPFIENHTYLGSEDIGATPPEDVGIEGVIGERVRFEKPYLLGNLKIYTESMKKAISPDNPKREIDLSAGYICNYEFVQGVFDGQKYDAIQRDIRSNHLAKVAEGRTGKDVRILDSKPTQFLKFTCDSAELIMAEENEKEVVKARLTEALDKLKDMDESERDELLKAVGLKTYTDVKSADEDTETKTEDDDTETKTEDDQTQAEKDNESEAERLKREEEGLKEREAREDKDRDRDREEAKTMDAAHKRIKELEAQLKTRPTLDSMFQSVADRDRLAEKVKPFIGVFDHSAMSAQQVASYAVKKIGLKANEGTEIIALDAWMYGRVPDTDQKGIKTQDSAISGKVNIYKKYGRK